MVRVSVEYTRKTLVMYNTAFGSVLGAFIGDAAGATLEFPVQGTIANIVRVATFRTSNITQSLLVPAQFAFGNKKWAVQHAMNMIGRGVWGTAQGQITDDGELTMALLRALSNSNQWDLDAIAVAYCEWLSSGPFDIGQTTKRAINGAFSLKSNTVPPPSIGTRMYYASSIFNKESQANGSLMRATPLGIWGYKLSSQDLATICHQDSGLTHPNMVCKYSVTCYAIAIAHLVKNATSTSADLKTRREAFSRAKNWLESEPESRDKETVLNCLNNATRKL